MKKMYCWRCQDEMPMLDEDEFALISKLYSKGMRATKNFRQQHDLSLGECSIEERFRPVREEYERITGWKDMHHNAIIHHRLSDFGALCPVCGKPFRTPKAQFCAECGYKPEQQNSEQHAGQVSSESAPSASPDETSV